MTIEDHVKDILLEIEDCDELRNGLADTPKRVAKMYRELFDGYRQDPTSYLRTRFQLEEGSGHPVVINDIEFFSTCEHHMIPFFGTCSIAYIPRGDNVTGLSKFVRIVNAYAHRLQVQERLTHQIASLISNELQPYGGLVKIQAKHLCMCARGVKNPTSSTTTMVAFGTARERETKADLLALMT